MRLSFIAVFATTALNACGGPPLTQMAPHQPPTMVSMDELVLQDGVAYLAKTMTPFTGTAIEWSLLSYLSIMKHYEQGVLQYISDLGEWRVSQEVSPVDDSMTVLMKLNAENRVDVKGWGSDYASYPKLVIRCKENKTSVYINYDSFLSTDDMTVLTRFDKNPAKKHSWGVSTDYEAVFAPSGVSWAKKIANASKLFVRLTPYGESPVSATFDLTGSEEAMRPLRATCGW